MVLFIFVAVVDVFACCVLSHRASSGMMAEFCVEALMQALANYGKVQIFNRDQGNQFKSIYLTGLLFDAKVSILLNEKGTWRINDFVEWLGRSVK